MEFKLILKKINETLNEEEKKIFDTWYRESEEHRTYFNQVRENYSKGLDTVEINKGWYSMSSQIDKRRNRLTYFSYAAAIVALFIISSLWFFKTYKPGTHTPDQSSVILEEPVEIGTDKATLTLEDGSQIALEKGGHYETDEVLSNGQKLVYKKGKYSSLKAPTQNVLTIPRGGQFYVVLADGTKVWLNSDTRLKYPVSFVKNETREVELVYGEAYFEVSPSSDHNGVHFIVHSEGQQVEVLGTEFNVKAYKEDTTVSTTLVEGKVLVATGNISENLTPGNQSVLNRSTDKLSITTVDIYNEVSWKNGLFSFNNQSLEHIMKVLCRWYDVDVVFQNENVKRLTFNGIFRKTQQLNEILNIIKNTNEVNYTIREKTVTME